MKSKKKKKDSPMALRNKEGEGRRLIRCVRFRESSKVEANQIELAIDQLLMQIIGQERARGESHEQQ